MRHEPITSRPVSYARQVWLASLGAVQVLQKEGAEIFQELVKEGQRIEAHQRARQAPTPTKDSRLAEAVLVMKEAYLKRFQRQLKEWDTQLEQVRKKARKAKAEARIKLEDELTKLLNQRAAAQKKLDALRSAGEQSWEDLRRRRESLE